ncbi:MinD/ParA family protein [Legionella sp. W05-934-2]|uniref:MinD/ParA family protein n=1 Tax=Legionella sp. W05-934-2 TaxID=1198649 RepID=UPI00346290E6
MSNSNTDVKDQASGLRNISRNKPVKVIAITAGKGGVGKSNVSVNLAVALAKKGNKVLLLDADLGLANIDIMLGLHARNNLSHVMEGKCVLNDIILKGPEGIQVVPASSGTEYMTQLSPMEHAGIIDAFNEITDDLDYMIIDTAAGISDTVLSFTRSAQELIVVVCDEPTSLTDAYALIKVMRKRYEWQNFHILANMVRKEKDGQILFNKLYRVADQFLDVNIDYLGAIPFDEHIHDAVKKQQPILLSYPDSPASKALCKLSDNVTSWSFAESLAGSTSFFIERLISEG